MFFSSPDRVLIMLLCGCSKPLVTQPEITAKQYMHAMKWTNEGTTDEEVQKNRDKEVEELKSASVLVWSESE